MPKPPENYRILFLGDSNIFGWETPENRTLSARIQRKLENSCPSFLFDAINAGLPGATSFQCLLDLTNRWLEFDPDLVVISCGFQ